LFIGDVVVSRGPTIQFAAKDRYSRHINLYNIEKNYPLRWHHKQYNHSLFLYKYIAENIISQAASPNHRSLGCSSLLPL